MHISNEYLILLIHTKIIREEEVQEVTRRKRRIWRRETTKKIIIEINGKKINEAKEIIAYVILDSWKK